MSRLAAKVVVCTQTIKYPQLRVQAGNAGPCVIRPGSRLTLPWPRTFISVNVNGGRLVICSSYSPYKSASASSSMRFVESRQIGVDGLGILTKFWLFAPS
jgi:hypothetical protein